MLKYRYHKVLEKCYKSKQKKIILLCCSIPLSLAHDVLSVRFLEHIYI